MNNKMFGATLLSGALSGLTLTLLPFAIFVGPGIWFALATGWVFYTDKRQDLVQGVIWVASCAAAWYLAMRIYSNGGALEPTFSNHSQWSTMMMSGLVGSFILAVIYSLLVRSVSLRNILVTAALGSVLAFVMYVIIASGTTIYPNGNGSHESLPQLRLMLAFLVWQVGVGLSLLAYKPRTPAGKATRSKYGIPYLIAVTILAGIITTPYLISRVTSQVNRQDIRTTKDINVIAAAIDEFDLGSQSLPTSLGQLNFNEPWAGDTGTRINSYTYHVTGLKTYELCGNFKSASQTATERVTPHPKGYSCFNLEDPRLASKK
jgi:hypothetical protein